MGATPGNLIFSPSSAASALAIAYAGARGTTAREMAAAMHWTLPPDRLHPAQAALARKLEAAAAAYGDTLLTANRLWIQQDLKLLRGYQELASEFYGPIGLADFTGRPGRAARDINAWVSGHTGNLIPQLVDASMFNDLTRVVIVNALYLRAHWDEPFTASTTHPAAFHRPNGDSTRVATMRAERSYGYVERPEVRLLELLYRGGDLSFVILLPAARDGLPRLEKSLRSDSLFAWLRILRAQPVDLSLPKFRFDSSLDLNSPLMALGMRTAFDPEAADFSGMCDRERLSISNVIQRAVVEVEETGTKAAAATAAIMQSLGIASPVERRPIVFRADHPFLFLIRERATGAILFFGRVSDPSA